MMGTNICMGDHKVKRGKSTDLAFTLEEFEHL